MKPLPVSLAILAVCGLLAEPASAAGTSKIREKATLSVSFDLQPEVGELEGASGNATLDATRKNGVQTGELSIDLLGLTAGEYTLEATNLDGTTVALGSVTVSAPAVEGEATKVDTELTAPEGINVLSLDSVSVLDAEGSVVLSGSANATTSLWKYFANVRVTAPAAVVASDLEVTEGKGKGGKTKVRKVNGHALAKSTIKDDEETKRQFLFVAKGAPASTLLTIVVDGEEIDEVESTPAGKVMFKEDLIEDVVIQTMKNISLVDEAGVVVMEANF
jgi:hypothetical protein